MKKTILILVFTLFSINILYGQVVLKGKSLLEYNLRAGSITEDFIYVENKFNEAKTISVFVDDETHKNNAQSARDWIKLETSQYIIPPGTVKLPFKIIVPENAEGSFWTDVVIRPEEPTLVGSSKIFLQYAVKIIITVGEGEASAKIKSIQYDKDEKSLKVIIENTSNFIDLAKVSVELKEQKIELGEKRLYPHYETEFSVVHPLDDELYEATVFVELSDGTITGKRMSFRVGEPPPPPPPPMMLAAEKEKRVERKKAAPLIAYIGFDLGLRRKGAKLSGRLRLGNFSLNSGTRWYYFFEEVRKVYFTSANYRIGHLSLSLGSYKYDNSMMSMAGISYYSSGFNAGANFSTSKNYQLINFNSSFQFHNGIRINVVGWWARAQRDLNLSVDFPIKIHF